jgi:PKD repeat protein
LTGNYGSGSIFTSPDGGVVIDSLGNYHFDPAIASLDTNLLEYEYTSPNQCMVSSSVELYVSDAPNAGFTVEEPCIPMEGGPVTFNNRSDTAGAVSWLWSFGDLASGSNNMSTEENPTHLYENTGSYTVTLRANMGLCFDEEVRTIELHQGPQADFTWSSSCFLTSSPTVLTGQETIFVPDTVSGWSWKIDTAGTEIFSSDTSGPQLSYNFPAIGTYDIRYRILTANGCSDTIRKTISLIPTFELALESYHESFEDAGHGWTSGAFNESHNSWTFDEISPDEFPVDTVSGTHAWYTDRPDAPTMENSWVLSPCFSFTDFYRPRVSLDIKRSLHRNRDGASLQYTVDDGQNWRNVGDEDDGGIEWYNSTGITPTVGGLHTGWTGTSSGEEDEEWSEAVHDLDAVAGKPEVRFRVAFGSLADERTETNDGFAFDNFRIDQRTRLSVLEYFTNANNSDCVDSDTAIMEIMNEVAADVIDIQYHARGDIPDKFFNDNNVPANSRGTIYGVTGIPYAVLDGNIMTYDFSGTRKTPNVEDIRQRSLKDPDFDLTITATEFTPALKFSIEIKALRDLERSDRTLYAIVLQKRVEDPSAGNNGLTVFRHVARKMIPSAAGTYLGSREWSEGETEYAKLTYEGLLFFPVIKDSLTIAVFIQNDETGEILQASTNPQFVVSTFDELDAPSRVFVYPNPARDQVHVYFEESPTEQIQFTLYDLSGKMVITDVIQPWQQQFSRTLDDVEQGMYIIEIRNMKKTRVFYRDKLLHY